MNAHKTAPTRFAEADGIGFADRRFATRSARRSCSLLQQSKAKRP